jgi:hypothetical protein
VLDSVMVWDRGDGQVDRVFLDGLRCRVSLFRNYESCSTIDRWHLKLPTGLAARVSPPGQDRPSRLWTVERL